MRDKNHKKPRSGCKRAQTGMGRTTEHGVGPVVAGALLRGGLVEQRAVLHRIVLAQPIFVAIDALGGSQTGEPIIIKIIEIG